MWIIDSESKMVTAFMLRYRMVELAQPIHFVRQYFVELLLKFRHLTDPCHNKYRKKLMKAHGPSDCYYYIAIPFTKKTDLRISNAMYQLRPDL